MKKTVVITGAEGFIGSHLVLYLRKKGYVLRLFDRRKHDLSRPESMDDLLGGADAVVHLAGANRAAATELLRVNTLGTLGLLEAMSRFCPKARIILASSSQVYLPTSLYGASKRFAEELIAYYSRTSSLQGIVLRFSNVYGTGCKPFYNSVIATFIHLIKNGQSLTVHGDGQQKRDYIYVADVVSSIEKVIEAKVGERLMILDICSGEQSSINQIIKAIQNTQPKKVVVHYQKREEIDKSPPAKSWRKAWQLIGWKPTTDLVGGIRKTIEGKVYGD